MSITHVIIFILFETVQDYCELSCDSLMYMEAIKNTYKTIKLIDQI